MTAHEELRERLAGVLHPKVCVLSDTDPYLCTALADALLPTVLAWGEERAREALERAKFNDEVRREQLRMARRGGDL